MKRFALILLLLVGTFAGAQLFVPRQAVQAVRSVQSGAIILTLDQKATFKTWLETNAAGKSDEEAAALANAAASPDFWCWRTLVSEVEIYEQPSVDATVWSWTIYIARSQAERDSWRQMVSMRGGMKPSLLNVRTGIADVFSGAGGLNQRTHLLACGRRKITALEKLYATGTGSTVSPGDLGGGVGGAPIEGTVTAQQVSDIRAGL